MPPSAAIMSSIDSKARYGLMAPAPKPTSNAMWCTSRASPHSTTNPTCVRVFSRMRWWCTAPVNRSDGTGAYTSSLLRSDNTRMRAPDEIAAEASSRTRSSATRRPSPPSATRYNPLMTVHSRCGMLPSSLMWMILARSSLSRIGNGNVNWRQLSGPGDRRFASGPTLVPTEVTTSSRMASSGGLVTCANNCWK